MGCEACDTIGPAAYFPCREKDLSHEVLAKLEELGAHWSRDWDCWAAFV